MTADSDRAPRRDRDAARDVARQRQPVTYAAVGATQAPDLMQYPPQGYRPLELRGRIGHGDDRWAFAVDELLTGGIYRGAGMGARITPVTATDAELTYSHVEFDAAGEAIGPAHLGASDEVYTAGGERYLRPGDIVVVGLDVGEALWLPLPGRVVLIEQATKRVSVAVGTLPGHVFSGEEAFTLEQTDDGSVWITVRSFARPAAWWGWPLLPGLLLARILIARRFLRAFMGPISAQSV